MSTNAKIKEHIQKLDVGDIVELYDLDATALGASTYHFTPNTTESGTTVYLNGVEYTPLPVQIEGIEYKGDGKLPRPTITIANVNLTFAGLVNSYNDGLGAVLTRRRTLRKYLDDGSEADSDAQFPTDVYILERKVAQDKNYIQWELVSVIDNESLYIPKRQCIAESCSHTYRTYDGGFEYTNATCPYTGTDYFTATGEVTTAANDVCGKRMYDCRLRYGNTEKPYRGFPGVGRLGYPYR